MTISSYPETRRDDTAETLHGVRVADPYRWLEDPDSEDTRTWVKAQNGVTRAHLDTLASRPWFHALTTAIVTRPRAGTPDKAGGRYVVTRNDGTREQDVLHVADTLDLLRDEPRVLLDPNTFSEDGTSSLFAYSASKDGSLLAYLVSDGGSDWTSVRVLDLATGQHAGETLTNVKFSEATWLPDRSFLYLHYEVEGTGSGTDAGALPGGRLRRHRVGHAPEPGRAGAGVPGQRPPRRHARALARRPLAGGEHPRGHVREEPSLGVPGRG